MVAFDTNYLVRHIVQDDARQCRTVANTLRAEIAEGRPVLLLDLVLMETFWVLGKCYGFDREAWCGVLEELLSDAAFTFESPKRLRKVLQRLRIGKTDFPDDLIHAASLESGHSLATFDRRLGNETGV